MAPSVTTTLSFAVLLAAFELGTCLRCYQCNSQQSPDCKDPFAVTNSKYLTDCSTQDNYNFNSQYLRPVFPGLQDGTAGASRFCHKIVLQTGTVIRTCLDGNPSDLNQTCMLLDSMANRNKVGPVNLGTTIKHCSVCDKEGCNAAGSIAASLTLASFAAVVVLLGYTQ